MTTAIGLILSVGLAVVLACAATTVRDQVRDLRDDSSEERTDGG